MDRKSIYIETSIVSYLAAQRSRSLIAAAWQEITREFWEVQRTAYDLYTSELVVEEASVGDPDAVARRLGFLRRRGQRIVQSRTKPNSNALPVPRSDGFYEQLDVDVIHFPSQRFVQTNLPMVYNPHDLQHLHYPEFFTQDVIEWRETVYRSGCRLAQVVVVGSQWSKDDLVHHYTLAPEKVQVVPWAAPTQIYPEVTDALLAEVTVQHGLTQPFALYPAATWQHKNHIALLETLAWLRHHADLRIQLVCTGYQTEFWPNIERRWHSLALEDQVKFLGVVPPVTLRAIYRLAQFVIIPSVFEPASFPVFEAWQEGVPVVCSSVAGLPEQTGGAALLFDPQSIESIATALQRMALDDGLRAELRHRGDRRLQDFSWDRTAKAYRAVYRRVAGFPLTEEDRWLLHGDWMREPETKMENEL